MKVIVTWITFLGCYNILAVMGSPRIPDVDEYWPEVADDLSLVTWSHATNNKDLLQTALTNDTIMMIEADVLMGHLTGSDDKQLLPIMAHPPHNTSDLSLEMFITNTMQAIQENGVKKGIKLDFKQLEVVRPSLDILSSQQSKLMFPVWLNADILPGPVDATAKPLNPDVFLPTCAEFFPEATMSVGWTTRYTNATDPTAQYTMAHVRQMLDVLERGGTAAQTVTFPVRAAFVERSLDALTWLVGAVPDSTLTVWGSPGDSYSPEGLLWLQETLGKDSVYLDLPPDQLTLLQEAAREGEVARGGAVRVWPRGSAVWASVGAVMGGVLAAWYYS